MALVIITPQQSGVSVLPSEVIYRTIQVTAADIPSVRTALLTAYNLLVGYADTTTHWTAGTDPYTALCRFEALITKSTVRQIDNALQPGDSGYGVVTTTTTYHATGTFYEKQNLASM